MKHKLSITLILLGMFLLTQIIGLYVVNQYAPLNIQVIYPETGLSENITIKQDLPFGLQPEENAKPNFISIIFAFIIAFLIISLLMKYKWKLAIKGWFFLVIALSLGITFYAILKNFSPGASIIALLIAIPLAYFKIFKPHFIIHNSTEVLIYPGIAAVFVPILTPLSIIIFLILISVYDMWAVWKSEVMQKMAKFQMEELQIFGGFLVPSVSKKIRMQIKNIKQKYKNKKMPKKVKSKKFKVSFAILGGGDVVFPIITAGIFMRSFGLVSALFVTLGALAGLTILFIISKKKPYPAMPYITAGIFIGMLIWRLFIY